MLETSMGIVCVDESDMISRALNYSGNYLNRIVNKYAGMCLFDYGMTFCLKKAAIRLSGTEESISSIAASLHFTNRTHFYTLFKKQYGITPKEYREQTRPPLVYRLNHF